MDGLFLVAKDGGFALTPVSLRLPPPNEDRLAWRVMGEGDTRAIASLGYF